MSRHGILKSKRSKLLALTAAGAFTLASAATAVAMTVPGGSPAVSTKLAVVARPASVTSVRDSMESRLRTQQEAATKKAAAKKAAELRAKRRTSHHGGSTLTGSPQHIANELLGSYGWSTSQFSCLYNLWERESGWNVYAENPSSGAYGIPQALPGGKMASAGSDWSGSAVTQIKWGLGYIRDTYGSPCGAWAHEETDGWY